MRLAIFIEPDGILNEVCGDGQYPAGPRSLEELRVKEAAAPLLYQLREAGFVLIATTNQPGLSTGEVSRRELDLVFRRLRTVFPLQDILVCPHDQADRCPCRKPKPGLFIEASFKYQINLERSYVISERWQDAEAARTSGCTSFLLHSPWAGRGHRDFQVADLAEAVQKILTLKSASPRLAYA